MSSSKIYPFCFVFILASLLVTGAPKWKGQKRDEYGAWSAMFQEDNCPYDQDCTSNIQCECEDYHLECRTIGSLNRRCIEVVDNAWERSGKPYKPETDKPFESIIQTNTLCPDLEQPCSTGCQNCVFYDLVCDEGLNMCVQIDQKIPNPAGTPPSALNWTVEIKDADDLFG
ncbi:Hypothetical predicted protein [Paramuricea clavata]|uniref:Uncharacterized protein n=1 Tax=Paramuricea clavata TaxID=317549 RepID=A0A7D9DGD8_PARCT|nr:Hypothetical predicted protein [Paramuricea clavata]